MTTFLLRLAPAAEAWRQAIACEPDPLLLVVAAEQMQRWLAQGAVPVRVLIESVLSGEPHALVIGPPAEPMWVPTSALVRWDGGRDAVLNRPADGFGSRVDLAWLPWTTPAEDDAVWLQVGTAGDDVLVRRWDADAGGAFGPLLRVSALDVIDRSEVQQPTETVTFAPGDLRKIRAAPGDVSSAALIAQFLGLIDATEMLARRSPSVAASLSQWREVTPVDAATRTADDALPSGELQPRDAGTVETSPPPLLPRSPRAAMRTGAVPERVLGEPDTTAAGAPDRVTATMMPSGHTGVSDAFTTQNLARGAETRRAAPFAARSSMEPCGTGQPSGVTQPSGMTRTSSAKPPSSAGEATAALPSNTPPPIPASSSTSSTGTIPPPSTTLPTGSGPPSSPMETIVTEARSARPAHDVAAVGRPALPRFVAAAPSIARTPRSRALNEDLASPPPGPVRIAASAPEMQEVAVADVSSVPDVPRRDTRESPRTAAALATTRVAEMLTASTSASRRLEDRAGELAVIDRPEPLPGRDDAAVPQRHVRRIIVEHETSGGTQPAFDHRTPTPAIAPAPPRGLADADVPSPVESLLRRRAATAPRGHEAGAFARRPAPDSEIAVGSAVEDTETLPARNEVTSPSTPHVSPSPTAPPDAPAPSRNPARTLASEATARRQRFTPDADVASARRERARVPLAPPAPRPTTSASRLVSPAPASVSRSTATVLEATGGEETPAWQERSSRAPSVAHPRLASRPVITAAATSGLQAASTALAASAEESSSASQEPSARMSHAPAASRESAAPSAPPLSLAHAGVESHAATASRALAASPTSSDSSAPLALEPREASVETGPARILTAPTAAPALARPVRSLATHVIRHVVTDPRRADDRITVLRRESRADGARTPAHAGSRRAALARPAQPVPRIVSLPASPLPSRPRPSVVRSVEIGEIVVELGSTERPSSTDSHRPAAAGSLIAAIPSHLLARGRR